jgi:hypothetical protein
VDGLTAENNSGFPSLRAGALTSNLDFAFILAGCGQVIGHLIRSQVSGVLPNAFDSRIAISGLNVGLAERLRARRREGSGGGDMACRSPSKSRRHLRGIMRVVFQYAVRWELIGKNPIDMVRVKGGKRVRIPRVLRPEDLWFSGVPEAIAYDSETGLK